MSDVLKISCPNCRKAMQVPASVAGKKIKCKECATAFAVPAADAAPKAKVAKAAPAKAKAVEPPSEVDAKRKAVMDEFAQGDNPYGITHDDSDVARCPFCAKELDPPDTMVCLECGYDMLARKRHVSKKVYHLETSDYIKHHLPAVACVLLIFAIIGLNVLCMLKMRDLFEGSFLETDEPDNNRPGKKQFYAPPGVCTLWVFVPSVFAVYKAGLFAYRRFFINWKPTETTKK